MPPIEEVFHGITVRDPYRWLEDRCLPETQAWIDEQKRRIEAYFSSCTNLEGIERRVRAFLDVEVIDQPSRIGGFCFYRKRARNQEQGCICVRANADEGERLLVDPAQFGPFASIGIHRISSDGTLLAFEVRQGGEDRKAVHMVNVKDSSVFSDSVPIGYSRGFAFTQNGDGYFYVQETGIPSEEHCVRLHHFGEQSEDAVVFRTPRVAGSRLVLTANEQRLGAYWLRQQNSEWVANFSIASIGRVSDWTTIFTKKRLPCSPMLWHDRILALVECETGSKTLIEIDPSGKSTTVFIPEIPSPVRQIAMTKSHIYVTYLDKGISQIAAWDQMGRRCKSIVLPTDGTVEFLPIQSQGNESFFYSCESFDMPPTICEYHSKTECSAVWFQFPSPQRRLRTTTRKLSVVVQDGVSIPITLVSAVRDIQHRASPLIMTSYGGFGVVLTPQFSVLAAILIELGATLAIPHVRGGSEFGRAWHEAGRARNRQVAIDDFISAAEWLCHEGLTTPGELAIFGGSNAGLLVAAAMTQRPDLFAAVLCIAPLLDMVRYATLGGTEKWQDEYGTVDDPDDFRALYAYSPYHRIDETTGYPATMFVAGGMDERCDPAHVRKMAARLQDRPAQASSIIVDHSETREADE